MDPATTKARILRDRALREWEEAQKLEREARDKYATANVAWYKAGERAGICVICDKPLAECECVFQAGGIPPT